MKQIHISQNLGLSLQLRYSRFGGKTNFESWRMFIFLRFVSSRKHNHTITIWQKPNNRSIPFSLKKDYTKNLTHFLWDIQKRKWNKIFLCFLEFHVNIGLSLLQDNWNQSKNKRAEKWSNIKTSKHLTSKHPYIYIYIFFSW